MGQAREQDSAGRAPQERIGVIGLGVMGAPMAINLAKAGYAVVVHDRDPTRAALVAAEVGHVGSARVESACIGSACIVSAPTAASLAAEVDIVITMLPDGRVVHEVITAGGVADAMRPGSLLLDTSSSEPWMTVRTAERLAAGGVATVDAPVSGAEWGARAADLVFMVGGAAADIDRVRPVLAAMGRSVHAVGPLGAGHTMKCINNLVTAMTFVATAEGLVIGKRCGLDPVAMIAVLNESTGGSWLTRSHFEQRVTSRTFDDPFRLDLMSKDVGIAMGLAADHGLPLPMSALGQQLYRAARLDAGPGASVSEMVRWIETRTATALTPGSSAGT